jgi:hypothetical protein
MKPLITPVINLNGNTADDLLEKLKLVLHNINHLQQSMTGAHDVVHGRNFQTVHNADITRREARDAWVERVDWLNQFHSDILTMALEIQAQGAERARSNKWVSPQTSE